MTSAERRRHAAPWVWLFIGAMLFTLALFGVADKTSKGRTEAAALAAKTRDDAAILVVKAQKEQAAKTRLAQIAACERGTVLRTQINAIEENVRANQEALDTFLSTAIKARKAAGQQLDLAAVKKYGPALRKLRAAAQFSKVDQPNCVQVVDHPVLATPR